MNNNRASADFTNRLIDESSPYLLQHAHNPVDWHPWGPEAFEIARRENKPIFLSVGYSTCYWCHVMERESFENEAVADEMNRRFVNIKVDREERPDVDQLYMTAVQVLTHQGGWPMSVFLTPDLRPFHGGTYFPPSDRYGRPGFVTLLRALEGAWRDRRQDVEKTAAQLLGILEQLAEPRAPEAPVVFDDALVERLVRRSISDYDPQFAGFGGAPKFPRETLLEMLLLYLRRLATDDRGRSPDPAEQSPLESEIAWMLRTTLDGLEEGGIHDQLGGGFHRYSTDARWLVPHFEIMLYDNAMLAWCYVEASRQFEEPRYAQIARGVFDFVLREMTSPGGGFYTAFDAEVDAREGLSYLWTAAQIEAILGAEDASFFNHMYGVDRGPNFADPHHGDGTPDTNILYLPQSLESAADELKLDLDALKARLLPMRQKLFAARSKRKQPILDTKIITSWNALMIRALAHGGRVLGEPRYLEAAGRAADFLLGHHRAAGGALLRASRDGKGKYAGFLDDYAYLAQAILALHGATGDEKWASAAGECAAAMVEQFADPENGAFFFTRANARDMLVRQKTATDSPLPSGNAVAAMVMLELGQAAEAQKTLAVFARQLDDHAEGMSALLQAAMLYLQKAEPFTVAPSDSGASGQQVTDIREMARQVVSIRVSWPSPVELRVLLEIRPGFHLNAHDVSGDALIATTLRVEPADGTTIEYPPGESMRLDFIDEPIRVYTGQATIAVHFAPAPPRDRPLRLALAYQACDNSACLPPVNVSFEAPV